MNHMLHKVSSTNITTTDIKVIEVRLWRLMVRCMINTAQWRRTCIIMQT